MPTAKLILVATPIENESPLNAKTKELLLQNWQNSIICVEEQKAGRRRWLHWDLPREAIDRFVLYNEHTRDEKKHELIEQMQKGKDVYLLSDCGLPAFCDPGQELVDLCHDSGITVTATPFANSIVLALAMSGFKHDSFVFEGFLPAKGSERTQEIKRVLSEKRTVILMDTAYRLERFVKELAEMAPERQALLAMDLNKTEEQLCRSSLKKLAQKDWGKREFILVLK